MDSGAHVKNICESLSSGMFNNLFTNPIYVAALITTSILLIVLTMYDENHVIKTGVYMFLITLCIVFIHNKLLLIEHRKALCDKESDNICNAIGDNVVGGGDIIGNLNYLQM